MSPAEANALLDDMTDLVNSARCYLNANDAAALNLTVRNLTEVTMDLWVGVKERRIDLREKSLQDASRA